MLAKRHRVTKGSFLSGQGQGRSFFVALLSLRMTKLGKMTPPTVAVIVSKKVAKTAVSRNRIRRRVYEAVSPLIPSMLQGTRYFLYPKKEVLSANFGDIKESCKQLLKDSGHRQ